jgi:hypothetical protein
MTDYTVDIACPAPLAYLDWIKAHHPEVKVIEDTEDVDLLVEFCRGYWLPAGGKFDGLDWGRCLGRL